MSRYVEKPWGGELIWAHTDKYVGKILSIKAGEKLSLQYHEIKDETILVLSGRLKLEYYLDGDAPAWVVLTPSEGFHIPTGMRHRMIAIDDVTVAEVSTPELDDVVRLVDDYGRVGQ